MRFQEKFSSPPQEIVFFNLFVESILCPRNDHETIFQMSPKSEPWWHESHVLIKPRLFHAKCRLGEDGWFTCPASISVWNFLAATPDDVNIEAPLPYL